METGNRGKTRTVRIRLGRVESIVLIGMSLLFMAFGVALFPDAADGIPAIRMFQATWCFVMLLLAGYGVYNLASRKGTPLMEIEIGEDAARPESEGGTPRGSGRKPDSP
jgi:hypothetical protein